jgi:hypothetical protein
MTFLKPLPRTKTHVRCGSPDCDWGAPLSSFSDGHLDQFREHCIERHGLVRFGGAHVDAARLTAATGRPAVTLSR